MSDVRPRAFAKRSADADPGAADPDAVKRLAYFWDTISPVAQGYFEELYEAMPDKVSAVLAGAVLARGGERTTLASWIETAKNEQGVVDTSGTTVVLRDVKVEPANPMPRAGYAVAWSVTADEKGFPGRKDRVRVLDNDGAQVAEKTIEQPAIGAGESVQVRAIFGALPLGSYQVLVVANVEGGDGSSMNEHGLQAYESASFVVGQTREAQLAEDAPKFGQVLGLVQSAVQVNATHVVHQGGPDEHKILDEHVLDRLAEAADELASMDVLADGFKRALGNAAEWLRRRPGGPYITEEEWATLRWTATRPAARPRRGRKVRYGVHPGTRRAVPHPICPVVVDRSAWIPIGRLPRYLSAGTAVRAASATGAAAFRGCLSRTRPWVSKATGCATTTAGADPGSSNPRVPLSAITSDRQILVAGADRRWLEEGVEFQADRPDSSRGFCDPFLSLRRPSRGGDRPNR